MTGGRSATVAGLRTFAMFERLSDAALKAIAQRATMRRMARNDIVVRAGDATDSVYLILSGNLKVLVEDEEGNEVIFSLLGPGDVFGEMGVLDDKPRSATVICLSSCTLAVITQADFMHCLREHFEVTEYMMRGLVRRLRDADRRIESLALMDVNGRVARLLLDMAETVDGKPTIRGRISRQDIARMVGASREMVSRVMKDLREQGLIEESEGQIVLHDLTG